MAESIKDRVAIIGMGCPRFGELWEKSATDLMVDAVYEAYEDANRFRSDPVYIKALQICTGFGEGTVRTDFDYTHIEETYRAGMRAYDEAGIKNPREEISMAEVHDCFSITEAVTMEDLQFSPRGKVYQDVLGANAGFFTLQRALAGVRVGLSPHFRWGQMRKVDQPMTRIVGQQEPVSRRNSLC